MAGKPWLESFGFEALAQGARLEGLSLLKLESPCLRALTRRPVARRPVAWELVPAAELLLSTKEAWRFGGHGNVSRGQGHGGVRSRGSGGHGP